MKIEPRSRHRVQHPARIWVIAGAVATGGLAIGAALALVLSALTGPAPQPPLVSGVRTSSSPVAPWTGSLAVEEDGPTTQSGCAPAATTTSTKARP